MKVESRGNEKKKHLDKMEMYHCGLLLGNGRIELEDLWGTLCRIVHPIIYYILHVNRVPEEQNPYIMLVLQGGLICWF